MSEGTIKVAAAQGITRLTLNRPPLNVLNIAMMEELAAALEAAGKEEGKVILLEAEGRAFSAGVDVADHTPEKVEKMVAVFDRIFHIMAAIDKPIAAAVNGAALGGGCELVLACDLVIASEKARFGQPEIMVGVFPPVAAYLLPRLIGYVPAMELLLSGETIDANRALALGLVNKVVPAENFGAAVEEFLAKFTDKSPVVLALTKKAVKAGLNRDFASGMQAIDRIYLEELMRTADAVEGLNAFLEKRQPVWQGR
ncbi:MAG: enoyl-CoA hydratase/isomerase family protein [Clostridia bacterium]|nr:enoyl-CoA hydratase/isomerase family protein [Clostridia bacterium]